jgi:chemotaxis protein MotB
MAKEESVIIVKKKKGGGHGHHGGAWKVAYADFVTAMMAFFLVMWLMGSDEETKNSIAHYFNHPNTPYKSGADPLSQTTNPLGEMQGEGENILNGSQGQTPEQMVQSPARPTSEVIAEYKDIRSKVLSDLDALVYGIELSLDHLKFSVAEDQLFEPGSSELKPGAEQILAKIGKAVSHYSGYMTIEGHVDTQATADQTGGASPYEFTMSRAVSVMNYFVKNRLMAEDRISPVGAGPKRAIASESTEEGRHKNRRIEFTLTHLKQL